jgi:Protein of unknown function (DUF3040)
MSLPAGQQRTLQRIERTLAAGDPELDSLFAVFTRLTAQDVMPRTEQVPARPRRLGSAAAMFIVLTALLGVILLSALTWSGPGCRAAPAERGQPIAAPPNSCPPGQVLSPGPAQIR